MFRFISALTLMAIGIQAFAFQPAFAAPHKPPSANHRKIAPVVPEVPAEISALLLSPESKWNDHLNHGEPALELNTNLSHFLGSLIKVASEISCLGFQPQGR